MNFDRFDICEAYYLFHCLWNMGGQTMHPVSGREIHTRLHRMQFEPAPSLSLETLNENAREIYDELERQEAMMGGKTPVPAWIKHLRAHVSACKEVTVDRPLDDDKREVP